MPMSTVTVVVKVIITFVDKNESQWKIDATEHKCVPQIFLCVCV